MRPGALLIVLALAAAVVARRRIDAVEVRGGSMAPTLLPGDRLLVMRARPRLGDVVLAPDPRHPTRELVKRVAAADSVGLVLAGDNASASTDAIVDPAAVRWRAVMRYWPADRIGGIGKGFPLVLSPAESNVGSGRSIPPDLAR